MREKFTSTAADNIFPLENRSGWENVLLTEDDIRRHLFVGKKILATGEQGAGGLQVHQHQLRDEPVRPGLRHLRAGVKNPEHELPSEHPEHELPPEPVREGRRGVG